MFLVNWFLITHVLVFYDVLHCFCVKNMSFEPLNIEFELQEQFWKFQNLAYPLERGNRRSSMKCQFPELLQTLMSARAGRVTLERQSHVSTLHSSVQSHTRAQNRDNQYFCRPEGSARAKETALEWGTLFQKFCKDDFMFCFHSLSLLSTLGHTLSIVNGL